MVYQILLRQRDRFNTKPRDPDTSKSHNPESFINYCVRRAHMILMVMKDNIIAFTGEPSHVRLSKYTLTGVAQMKCSYEPTIRRIIFRTSLEMS